MLRHLVLQKVYKGSHKCFYWFNHFDLLSQTATIIHHAHFDDTMNQARVKLQYKTRILPPATGREFYQSSHSESSTMKVPADSSSLYSCLELAAEVLLVQH